MKNFRIVPSLGRARRIVMLLSVFAVALTIPAYGLQSESADAAAQRYLGDIKALTTPEMEGRGDGTKGLTRAEHMLVQRYKSLGLEPAGTNGYAQPFTVITRAPLKGQNYLRVESGGTKSEAKLNQEFVPFSFSSSGSFSGAVVFAGYGISAGEFGYDDYENLDVKDKVVVVLRNEPATFAAKSGNQGETRHATFITKAINARNRGAKAIIFVNGKMGAGEEDLLLRFGSAGGPDDAGILILQVKSAVADQWLHAAGKSLARIQDQIVTFGKPHSKFLPPALPPSLPVNLYHTK